MITAKELAEAELAIRDQLARDVMEIVLKNCKPTNGHVARRELQQVVHTQLGLAGAPGQYFSNFVTNVLEEHGYRSSYFSGRRVYYGLRFYLPDGKVGPSSYVTKRKKAALPVSDEND